MGGKFTDGKTVTLAAVVGNRPNLMKMAPVIRAIQQRDHLDGPRLDVRLMYTGTANDARLHDTSFGDLQMPQPDICLGVGKCSATEETARIMMGFERAIRAESIDGLIVVGDSNATLACTLVAARARLPVFHVEAGLRSADARLPEEINRKVTDSLSTLLFTSSEDVHQNLEREGIRPEAMFCVGNAMVDNLFYHLERSRTSDVLERLGLSAQGVATAGIPVAMKPRYGVITLTRAENVDAPGTLRGILQTLCGVSRVAPIVFPASEATRRQIEQLELDDFVADLTARLESFGGASPLLPPGLYTVPPMAYLDFLRLLSSSTVVFTDSGGIQEETTAMGIPCITLREDTERPITVAEGTNVLVGADRDRLRREALAAFAGHGKQGRMPRLWDGHAADRIMDRVAAFYRRGQ